MGFVIGKLVFSMFHCKVTFYLNVFKSAFRRTVALSNVISHDHPGIKIFTCQKKGREGYTSVKKKI